MPITVSLPSRNVELEFPDSMTEQEIQAAIEQEYPRSGEDVAYEVEQTQSATIEGRDLNNPFIGMSNEDYRLLRQYEDKKSSSLGDLLGIAKDTFQTITNDVGTALGATIYTAGQGEFGKAFESAKEGVVAGTVGLVDIAGKILSPRSKIPTKEEWLRSGASQTIRGDFGEDVVTTPGRRMIPAKTIRGDFGQDVVVEPERPATEEDYNAFVESEKQRDIDAVNHLYAIERVIQGAPIEEIARGSQYLDATIVATGGGSLAAKGLTTIFKPAAKPFARAGLRTASTAPSRAATTIESGEAIIPVGMRTAPGPIGQAALTGVERAAGAVETVASLPRRTINVVGDVVESVAPGTGLPAKGAAVATATLSGAGVPLAGAAATEKVAEVVGATARAAMGEASRASPLERVAMNGAVSPAGRKLAAGLAQLQPIGTASYSIGKQAVKEGLAGSAVGAGLGYLAEGNLEGAAAGAGAGAAIGGFSGTLRSSFDLGREMVGLSTSRTRKQATGDINRFLGERPEVEQAAWAETMNRLVEQVGPERAAAQIDALRIAEANGATVRVATPDEIKQWKAPGWVESGKNELVLNPTRIIGDTAAHETSHVLFSSVLNRAFRSEIEQAIIGVTDPVTKEVIRPGIFDDAALARIADQISEAYGESNTGARDRFKGFAENLRNSIDQDKLGKVRIDIVDELVATYTGRMMDRSRPGRFNPDRLPLLYRRVLNSIDETVRNTFQTVLFEKGMDLRFDSATKSFKTDKGKTIRIPELDAIIKRAFAKPGSSAAKAAKAKPDLIPVNPADRAVWARSYGGAKGILNDDLTPKSISQINDEALRRWQDKTKRLSALPDTEKIGLEFSKDKNGQTVVTARGKLSQAAIDIIVKGDALDDSAEAVLRGILDSWQTTDKSTFDTRYYGVYDRGKGSNKMVAGVKSASQNEILPYSIEANSKDGIIIRAVDMTKVRERLSTALNKPQFKNLYKNPAEALSDFKLYLDNLTKPVAMESAMLLGGGEIGAKKRNLFYDTLGFRLRNGESLVNVPESTIAKSQNTIKSYRVERFAKLQESGFAFPFEEATTYERGMKNFQPDAFTKETLPNGEAMTNPDGYRILKKTGSSLFRVYDDKGELIGVAKNELGAMRMAQRKFIDGWHGSPHNFMRFMTQKIGTGEGAQAYGYGLYIAEDKGVARGYQETLAGTRLRLADGSFADEKASTPGARKILREARATWNNIGDLSGFRQKLLSTQSQARVWAKQGYSTEGNLQYVADVDEVLRLISESTPERTGSLYRVQLNVLPEQLLDWDKPLSEQSEGVKAFMNRAAEKVPFDGIIKNADGTLEQDASGRMLYEWLTKQQKGTNKESQVSNLLSKNGIPGIRYLDGGSRATGEGTSNYVIFDDGLIRVLDRNGKPVGKRLFRDVAEEGYNVRFQPDDTAKKATKEEKQTRFQPVTPEQDAAYLNAVKAGDNSNDNLTEQLRAASKSDRQKVLNDWIARNPKSAAELQRMVDEAASESGYDTYPWYHGGTLDPEKDPIPRIKEGKKSKSNMQLDFGLHLARDRNEALAYAGSKNSRVSTVYLTQRGEPILDLSNDASWIVTSEIGKKLGPKISKAIEKQRQQNKAFGAEVDLVTGEVPVYPAQLESILTSVPPKEAYNALRAAGYSGAQYTAKANYGTGRYRPFKATTVIESPTQVKLSDPITYDDAGNVIPLSQRFNPESPDIRFQPDSASPNIQVGTNGTRIIKSPSGKFRVYSVTGTLLGIRDSEQAAQKLATK